MAFRFKPQPSADRWMGSTTKWSAITEYMICVTNIGCLAAVMPMATGMYYHLFRSITAHV